MMTADKNRRDKSRFSVAARVRMIKDVLYYPVLDEQGNLLCYSKRNLVSERTAKKLMGAK